MLLLKHSTAVVCAVFIITGAVSGEEVKKAVGGTVSFRLPKLVSPVTSITWKHINGGTVKAIEWDEDGVIIPNPKFKDITTLDEKTGEITIIKLKVEHSGIYTIDINSKEQQLRFSLEVMERVPKPEITIEKSNNTDAVYLRCGYSETIIWKNSTGDTLKGTKNHTLGEFITVENTKNPDNYYTCTLKNAVSEATSDRVYERDIFVTERVPKPEITIEKDNNTDAVYLRCGYSETIIWKNSTGHTLKGTKNHNPGEFITVRNTRNPANFYTCTLKNAVSEETSDPVYERDIFGTGKTESNPGLIAGIVIGVLLLIAIILIYLLVKPVHAYVNTFCSCIPKFFGPLDCLLKKDREPKESQLNDADSELLSMTTNPSPSE